MTSRSRFRPTCAVSSPPTPSNRRRDTVVADLIGRRAGATSAGHEVRGKPPARNYACPSSSRSRSTPGIEPDYDDRAGWWRCPRPDRFAIDAAVIMIRLAAEQTGASIAEVCGRLAADGDAVN